MKALSLTENIKNNKIAAFYRTDVTSGKILDCNNLFANVLGFESADQLLAQNITVKKFYKDEQDRLQTINKIIADTEGVYEKEIYVNNKYYHLMFYSKHNAKLNIIDTIAINITDKIELIKKLQENESKLLNLKEKAEKSSQIKSKFLANISHEFRTPMNSILGMADLLLKTDLSKKQFNFINIIIKSAENLLVIINDILDFSKIESGEFFFVKKSFRLKDILTNVLNTVYYSAKQKNLNIECPYLLYGGEGYLLKSDPVRLQQILLNLVDNAIKYTNKGEVKINIKKLRESENNITICFFVEDTGIGIPKSKQQEIFNSFTQIYKSNNRNKGTGLGLTITKKLVEMMGGKLNVESELNKGSVFSFCLEFEKGSLTELLQYHEEERIQQKDINRDIKILVAEDDKFNQMVVLSMIEDWGFKVDIAEDGKQVINMLQQNTYDLVLMDIQMPELDGVETTKYIRSKMPEPQKNIPIIAVTANAYIEDHKIYYKTGINDVISKPFKSDILFNKIISLIKQNTNNQTIEHTQKAQKQEKLYSLEIIKKVAKNNPQTIKQMLEVFINKNKEEMKSLMNALTEKNIEQIAHIAHKIKPSVAYLGMLDTEKKLNNIVQWARKNEEFDKMQLNIILVNEILQKVFLELEKEIKQI